MSAAATILPATQAAPIALTLAYRNYTAYLDASPRTVQTYSGNVRQFVKWTQAAGIHSPTREDVIAWREELKKRCKPSTVQNYISALRLFFQWTEQAGIYPNIAAHVKGAKLDTGHKKDYLTSTQARVLLDSIDQEPARGKRDYAIIALMITGGLRDIEICRADIGDLRLIGDSSVLYLQGKGREERTEYVKIVPEVERALRSYLKIRQRPQKKQPLFASLSNNSRGERLSTRTISSIVKGRLRAAGYDSERLTAHSLRHTAVTLSLMGGLPLDEVQQFARHRNISTTQIYAHNLDRARNRSEETIAGAIFGGDPGR